ncbi:hypothetical protein L6164_020913 [Bauhinia variegata]|uniref:Uncharacterized protein n=1 Tax=Bauhinia variegata TaxID=167791 RepID=A0ACB9MWI9_BAUVA|nr:hypothetical protein L6164_020913 [Bauhinia variegata]
METSFLQKVVIAVPITSSKRYLPDLEGHYNNSTTKSKQNRKSFLFKLNLANGVREHVRLGSKITDTVKGKLNLGARILQVGGLEKVFMQLFSVREGERLLKASQCYLSTTSGPIAGLLFISTHKVAFCSERSIKISTPEGELIRIHYKVLIPTGKIKCVNQSENEKKRSQKYIQLITVDHFDFWFMGLLNYRKTLKYLQQAISEA